MVSVLKSYPSIFLNPVVAVLYLVVLGLVGVQYKRVQSIEERVYGRSQNKAFHQTIVSIGLGLVGGLLASVLLVVVGVTVSDSGIGYLLPTALLLFLFHPRFLCFSYAGGLLSVSNILFGWPKINVAAIMALVACLHAAEAFLIWLSGSGCATPLYIQTKNGKVAGGFSLQRFWPIPLIVLYLVKVPDVSSLQGLIHLPDWWPLISASPVAGPGLPVFVTMPIVAALGYGDLSVARTPREKAKHTAKNLFIYSGLLLGFSVVASRWKAFSLVAALFGPIAHEVVIKTGSAEEFEPSPYYGAVSNGVMIMEVFDGTPAKHAGLQRGDIVLKAGGLPVRTREELNHVLMEPGPVTLEVTSKRNAKIRDITVRRTHESLGIVTAPDLGDRPVVSTDAPGPLINWIRNLKR